MSRRSEKPAYKRIEGAIRRRIDAGELKPGNMVPSERELARIHQVSLMTARHALTELARDGIVERRRGAGTFVALPRVQFNKLLGYTEQTAGLGLTAHSRIVTSTVVSHESEIAARLGIAPTARIVRLERVRLAQNEPVALEVGYWSEDECCEARSTLCPCFLHWNTIAASPWPMPTRRSTPPMLINAWLTCCTSAKALHCCAFAS
jgi:GntR family transcriptional regulator